MVQFMANSVAMYGGSVAFIVVFIYGVRKYRSRAWGKCTNTVRLDGKIVIITGANSGLGYETAKELSLRGAQIIMACRNKNLALTAIANIEKANKIKEKLVFLELDLASMQSIAQFSSVIAKKYPCIDILINNAGVSIPLKTKTLTTDGFEIHFGVNYLGHFTLTNLLMPLLEKSKSARVLNVSSLLHQKGFVNLSDINYDHHSPRRPYADSKLQQIYFGQELACRAASKHINVYNLCPGWVFTNLFRHSFRNIFKLLFAIPVALLFMRSARQGAQTIIYCATEPSLEKESGLLYRDCHKISSNFNFQAIERQKLWTMSQELVEAKGIKITMENENTEMNI